MKLDQRDRAPNPVMHQLEHLAIDYSTDKNKCGHNYMPVYIDLFGHRKEEPISILELGTDVRCKSARMWEKYFPNAVIYGADIQGEAARHESNRLKIFAPFDFGIEEDLVRLKSLLPKEVDYIIDDASHNVDHIIACHTHFWDLVKPGGAYVIEDTSRSFLKVREHPRRGDFFQGTKMLDYFGKVIAALNGPEGHPLFHNYDKFKKEGYPYGNDWTTRIAQIRFQAEMVIMDYRSEL